MFYTLYGLRLEANTMIPCLTPSLASEKTSDLDVRLGMMPGWLEDALDVSQPICYSSSYCDRHGHPLLTVRCVRDAKYLRLTYADSTEFLIDRAGTRIWSTWP